MIRKRSIWDLGLLIVLVLPIACEREEFPDLPEQVLILNNWIWEGMNDVYLWEQHIPDIDPRSQADPEAYFYSLLYEEDRNSWITDDYDELIAMFSGVEKTTGMSARPGMLNDTTVISIVEYVTPNSPAADSGIERGDVILTIDGKDLTPDNYYPLYNQTTAAFGFGEWTDSTLQPSGREITLTAVVLNQNPVIYSDVLFSGDEATGDVGYLVYTQFTSGADGEWRTELNKVFTEFRSRGVEEVVVDLRYNRGGSLDLSAYIASTLGPSTAMENNEVYVNLVWNDFYNEFWKEYDLDGDGQPDGEDSEQLVIELPRSDLNLDLSRVFFLTTGSTASASESLIAGLYPYTEVVQIGTRTFGKCYGSITVDDWEEPKRHNWAMQPLVLKYANAEGFTDFVDGIEPDYTVEDDLVNAAPFGSLEDPMLSKALEVMTGTAPAKKAAEVREFSFTGLPVPVAPVSELRIELPPEALRGKE